MWMRRQSNRDAALITFSFLITKKCFPESLEVNPATGITEKVKQVPGCLGTEYFKDLSKKAKPQHHHVITGLCRALGEVRLLSTD